MTLAVRHESIGGAGLPHRLRIAHVSDLHLWFGGRKLRAIERQLEAWRPDVLALTGDYADTPVGRRIAADWIARMARAYPLCWVAGNHDRWCGGGFLRELEALPHAHPVDCRDAWVAGRAGRHYRFTSWERMGGQPRDRQGAGDDEGVPTIVLLHDPAEIRVEKLRGVRNRVLLAGHLHGGQITLWRDRGGRPQPAAWFYRWLVERVTIHAVPLIVSRGLGDTLPLRIGTPREIVMVDFWSA